MAEVPIYVKLIGEQEVISGLGGLANALKETAKAGGVLFLALEAVNKLKEEFVDARKEAQDFTKSQIQLHTALGYTSEALNKQSEALSHKYMIDEKDIKQAQAQLAMHHLTEEQIKKLTPAILDYAQAQGLDLVSATNMVTRAIDGQGKTMRGLPGILNGVAGSAEKVDSVYGLIEGKFKGQADAVLESKDGWDRLSYSLKEYNKQLGIVLFGQSKDAKAEQDNKNAIDQLNRSKAELAKMEAIQAEFSDKSKSGMDKYLFSLVHNKEDTKAYTAELKKNVDMIQKQVDAYEANQKAIEEKAKADNLAAKKAEEWAAGEEKRAKEAEEFSKEELEVKVARAKQAGDIMEKAYKDEQEAQKKSEEEDFKIEDSFLKKKLELRQKGREILKSAEEKQEEKTHAGRLKLLLKKQKEELDLAKRTGGDLTALEAQQAQERTEFAKKETIQKLEFGADLAKQTLSTMSEVADASKANAQVKKRISEGEAIIDGAKAVMGIWSTSSDMGQPAGSIFAGIETALVVATTAAQVAKIESTKFAYGGVATGGTPGRDSIPASLSPGEIVYNPAHPNPALASMINSGNNSMSSETHIHFASPQVHIHGSPDTKSMSKMTQALEESFTRQTHKALQVLTSRGKMPGTTVFK